MKYLVKYMCQFDMNNDVTAEAHFVPSYEISEILTISDYTIQIQNILKKSPESWIYLIKVINMDMNIPEIYTNEESLDDPHPRLISLIKTLIADKIFEREFTLKTLDAIYKKSK